MDQHWRRRLSIISIPITTLVIAYFSVFWVTIDSRSSCSYDKHIKGYCILYCYTYLLVGCPWLLWIGCGLVHHTKPSTLGWLQPFPKAMDNQPKKNTVQGPLMYLKQISLVSPSLSLLLSLPLFPLSTHVWNHVHYSVSLALSPLNKSEEGKGEEKEEAKEIYSK